MRVYIYIYRRDYKKEVVIYFMLNLLFNLNCLFLEITDYCLGFICVDLAIGAIDN